MYRNNALAAFATLFLADFAVRTAYMAGKSPVLQVFADQLGANEILLGTIVSVSTFTGMCSKPIFGILSDRYGRWIWLMIGTALFAFVPLLYLGVDTTEALVKLRLLHGLATAIYGPVTLAFIADLNDKHKAEWYGWFGLSRTGGYALGPLIGGVLLSYVSAAQVYACTSLIALLAFIPVLLIREGKPRVQPILRFSFPLIELRSLIVRNSTLLGFGLVEMSSRIGVYAVKTFLPLMVLTQGGTPIQAGVFLSIQEIATAVTRPLAGRLADQFKAPEWVAVAGLTCMSGALAAIPAAASSGLLILTAIAVGIGNGAYHPAAMFMIAHNTEAETSGIAFGIVGAMRNLGKLLGPIIGGTVLFTLPTNQAFWVLALTTLVAIVPIINQQTFAKTQELG